MDNTLVIQLNSESDAWTFLTSDSALWLRTLMPILMSDDLHGNKNRVSGAILEIHFKMEICVHWIFPSLSVYRN